MSHSIEPKYKWGDLRITVEREQALSGDPRVQVKPIAATRLVKTLEEIYARVLRNSWNPSSSREQQQMLPLYVPCQQGEQREKWKSLREELQKHSS